MKVAVPLLARTDTVAGTLCCPGAPTNGLRMRSRYVRPGTAIVTLLMSPSVAMRLACPNAVVCNVSVEVNSTLVLVWFVNPVMLVPV